MPTQDAASTAGPQQHHVWGDNTAGAEMGLAPARLEPGRATMCVYACMRVDLYLHLREGVHGCVNVCLRTWVCMGMCVCVYVMYMCVCVFA